MRDFRTYRSLDEVGEEFKPSVLTIGNFDGVHMGHRKILRRVVQVARDNGWKPSVLTFDPHPLKVVAPERTPHLLTTPEQRARLMQEEGIEQVLILPFDHRVEHLSPEDFVVKVLLERLGARVVLVGDNFRFGYRHAGDTKLLEELARKHGFRTEVVSGVRLRSRIVSSSVIRKLISVGKVTAACRQLGMPYHLEGEVVPGHGVGSRQTVPTLNLRTKVDVLPAAGVYVTRTQDLESNRTWPSVTNVGYRPTFDGRELSIETFLLSGLEGAAPSQIRVEFLHRLREERKFESPEALKQQIMRDVARAQGYFRRRERFVQ